MDFSDKIGGYNKKIIKDLFIAFNEIPLEFDVNASPPIRPKRFTNEFVSKELAISSSKADKLISTLTNEGYLESHKAIPSTLAGALVEYIDRSPILRSEAKDVIKKIIFFVKNENSIETNRNKISSIEIFGSYLGTKKELGDIDIFVTFIDLGLDFQPEDLSNESDIIERLCKISEYISPHDALDKEVLSPVDSKVIYTY